MTRLRLALIVLCLSLWASSAHAAQLHFVSRVATSAGTNSTTMVSPSQTHVAGNLLVAVFQHQFQSSADISTVANTALDTWTQTPKTPQGTNVNHQEIWYVLSTAGHVADIVTGTTTGSNSYTTVAVYELSTDSGVWSFVTDAKAVGNSTAISSGTLTITQSSVLIGMYETDTGAQPTSPSGTQASSDGGSFIWDSYQITSSSGAVSATQGSNNWTIIAAAFTAGAGGGCTAKPTLALLGVGNCGG